MIPQTLWIPLSVLNDQGHSANTRLIWLLLGRHFGGSSAPAAERLQKLSGLSPKTIALALAGLAQVPPAPSYVRPMRACAAVPAALLTDAGLSANARLLYGQLQAVPTFKHPGGSFTYVALSQITGNSVDTLRRTVTELAAAGWLTVTRANRKSPLSVTLRNPAATRLSARISSIRRRVRGAQYRGETLLREFLNAMVALDDYQDNAAPDFLLNPFTRELMELDRCYPADAVAFEFNGAQHYEETEIATLEETVKQVGRDAMKAFLCKAQGIELVIIRPEDLNWKAIELKLPGRLPRRDMAHLESLRTTLDSLAAEYRDHTAEQRARNGNPPAPTKGARSTSDARPPRRDAPGAENAPAAVPGDSR